MRPDNDGCRNQASSNQETSGQIGNTMNPIERVLRELPYKYQSGDRWIARCPAHDDKDPSLSVNEGDDRRVLIHCHAGCSLEQILSKLRLQMRDLFPQDNNGKLHRQWEGGIIPLENPATPQPSNKDDGCTLKQYVESKKLPVEFLNSLGLKEVRYSGLSALRIPYFDAQGSEGPVRFRLRLEKSENADGRFKWRRGSKLIPYGLWRLDLARKLGYAIRVEGESDCHTAWHHGLPAFGIPGASNWREEWSDYFDGIPIIYDVIEADKGGESWLKKLSTFRLRDRVRLVRVCDVKDLSELHCADPEAFLKSWQLAKETAVPFAAFIQAEAKAQADDAWRQCEVLARKPHILDRFAEVLKACSVAGEARTAKIIYLSMTSRFLNRPISLAVKGPSSGGKSFITERVLSFFPDNAYYALSAMSERALAYSEEPLSNKFLVIYEAAGLHGDFASYLLRSLLSEGCVRYETVEKTSSGMRPRLIKRDGPTGVIVTTTKTSLHPENETRMFSLSVIDTPEQTREVLLTLADEAVIRPDLGPWHALQTWLESAEHRVTIPYSRDLAERIPPVATRLRRDFTAVLNLIRAHAILHQAQRERDSEGQIVAALEDYEKVRELVADLLAEGLDATISLTLRETVEAVEELTEGGEATSYTAVARNLRLDKATAHRRVSVAIEKGYVRNLEERRGREARLIIAEPLSDETRILPLPEDLWDYMGAKGCKEDATTKTQSNHQDDRDGCRIAADLEELNTLTSQTSSKCVECGTEFNTETGYETGAEVLCAFCAADRVILNAGMLGK